MKLKHYEFICLFICIFLGCEYAIFNGYFQSTSIIRTIAAKVAPQYSLNLDPTPGYPLSYFLGWLGFGIMLLMNLYILRKRTNFFKGAGKLPGWLDFHIFCGLLGPILIIFHSNFKVDGLVSISFWSMIIASSSGIVGRYFYIQTLQKKEDLKKYIQAMKAEFTKNHRNSFDDATLEKIFQHSFSTAGVRDGVTNPLVVFTLSLISDISLFFINPGKPFGLSKKDGKFLKKMGVENRRVALLVPFNQLLGYWHSFHLPFAFFMYFVAVIHIITALLFGVKH